MSWKFFYKPTTTGIPLIAGNSHKLSDGQRLRELGFGGTVPEIPILSTTTSIWGKVHDMASKTTPGTYALGSPQAMWSAVDNFPSGKQFDQYIRLHALDNGIALNYGICGLTGLGNAGKKYSISNQLAVGNVQHTCYDEDAVRTISHKNVGVLSLTAGNIYDLIFRADYSNPFPVMSSYLDGVLLGAITGTSTFLAADFPFAGLAHGFGANYTFGNAKWLVEHYGVYDGHIPNPTDYVAGGAVDAELLALVGTPTDTDPGIAQVLSGTEYIFAGLTLTGTLNVPTSTDPGIANVLSGTSYIINDSTLSGTYHDGSYSDPGISNVRVDTNYIFNDSTLTGTLSVPAASTGTANTVPLNELKEQIRYVLATNNTTTGAPVDDLSGGLARRVQMILKVNPEKIPPNDNILPALTVFIDSKNTAPDTIARNGSTGKRKAEINIKIAGMVWEPYTTDRIEDPADEDLETLMENAEKILRGYDNLGGNVSWQFPTAITYHSLGWDEKAHYRGALMDIKATVHY